jgi:polyhydroxybutyrate depolymerase
MRLLFSVPFVLCFASACSTPAPVAEAEAGLLDAAIVVDDAGPRDAGPEPIMVGTADRPATVIVPPAHDGTTELPLLIVLHGYGASGRVQDAYFKASIIARERGFYLITPDGTVDTGGSRFWNAQPGCCNFGGSTVDDVAYLTGLIDQAEAQLPIDRTRIYFLGHSNGGFMSYRMACEISDRIAGIAVLAGGDFVGATDCVPDRPVSVLHMHGTADATVSYESLATGLVHAGAVESTQRWATRAGCDLASATEDGPFDFDNGVAGDETTTTDYEAGCTGAVVSLYTMEGSPHIPALPQTSVERAIDWLLARSAPAP